MNYYFSNMLRVDTVPWYWKPMFLLFGYGLGLYFYLYTKAIALTCKLVYKGNFPHAGTPVIYCIWHKDLVLYFAAFHKVQKQVWMNHPAWYMKPVHVLLKLTGVEKICLGSSGNSGKLALEQVINHLKEGYSTVVASDGPAGPPQVLKPGVLWMSRDAQVPIIPIHFSCSRSIRLGGWDKKVIPGLFSTITITAGKPIQVTEESLPTAEQQLIAFLNS